MHHLAQIGKDDRSTNISAVKNTIPGLSGIISSVSTRKKGGFLSPLSCRIPVLRHHYIYQPVQRRTPLYFKRMMQNYSLFPIRTCGYHINSDTGNLFNTPNVLSGIFRQILILADTKC